jgi:hypothetical protein
MYSKPSRQQLRRYVAPSQRARRVHLLGLGVLFVSIQSGCEPSTYFGFNKGADSLLDSQSLDSQPDSPVDSEPDVDPCPPPARENLVSCDTFVPDPLLADEVLIGDMNGDDADDLLTWFDEGGCAFVSLADGAGALNEPTLWLDLGARVRADTEIDRWPLYRELGDVDADGRDDLVWGERCDASAQWFVAPSNGTQLVFEADANGTYPGAALARLFWPLTKTLGDPGAEGYWVVRVGDVSPAPGAAFGVDGMADLVATHVLPGDSYETEVYVSLNADPTRLSFLNDPTTQPWSSGTMNAPKSGVFLAELGAGSAMCGYGWRVLDLVGFSRHDDGKENWFASTAWGGNYPTAPRGGFDNHWDPWMTTGRTAGYVPSTEAFVADVTRDGGDDALWYIDAVDGGPAWVIGVSLFTTCSRIDSDDDSLPHKAFDDPGKVLALDDLGRLLETPLTFSDGALRRLVGDVNGDTVTDLVALDGAGVWQIQLMTPPCVAMSDAPSGARWALCRGRTSWDQASADCKTKGGALAHPRSAADHLALSQALGEITLDNSSLRAWIGLSDRVSEGNFVWEDGAALDTAMTSYWRSGSPSSTDGAKDCVFVDSLEQAGDGAYLMKDVQCSSDTALGATSAYVCELDR